MVRNLEIVGEAVKSLSVAAKKSHPEVPWRQIAGMRDKLAHDYFGVDLFIIWSVVETRLPQLLAAVAEMIDREGCRKQPAK